MAHSLLRPSCENTDLSAKRRHTPVCGIQEANKTLPLGGVKPPVRVKFVFRKLCFKIKEQKLFYEINEDKTIKEEKP
ncbi:MAG: hypothetical protein LBJ95_03730 [Oscillospiraceae bacterium]|jgi:hypothetical protein|nr:hypothetical protein [Oscillospiraceae bacterium]